MMDSSFEDDLVLTQNCTKDYCETQSAGYGDDVIVMDNSNIVSLEVGEANFELVCDGICSQTQPSADGGIQIEDISDEEAIDKM